MHVETSTVIFIAVITLFLLVVAISTFRIHEMTVLDESEDLMGSAGVAQTSSYTVDSEQ